MWEGAPKLPGASEVGYTCPNGGKHWSRGLLMRSSVIVTLDPRGGKMSDRVLFDLMIYNTFILHFLLSIFNISSPSHLKQRNKVEIREAEEGQSTIPPTSPPYTCCPHFNRAVLGLLIRLPRIALHSGFQLAAQHSAAAFIHNPSSISRRL